MIAASVWGVLGGAVAGLIAGSFIATLVIRWPQGRTLGGRSACDGCGRVLSVRDLIPLLSWAAAGGRCRTCKARIGWRHPAIEAASAGIGAMAMATHQGLDGVAFAFFGWQLLALAALDVEHFWLPDRLTGALAVSGILAGLAGTGLDLSSRMIGGIAGFAALFVIASLYRRVRGHEGMGGGDPKLLGAIGCWIGWQALPYVLLVASALGLSAALAMKAGGADVAPSTRLPLGTLMAVAAFPIGLLFAQR